VSEATDAEEREVMDWRRYGVAVRELAQMIADDGYRPFAAAACDALLDYMAGRPVPAFAGH